MRGSRAFKKLIEKTPSGKYRWSIVNRYGQSVASGQAVKWALARNEVSMKERQIVDALPYYGRGKKRIELRSIQKVNDT